MRYFLLALKLLKIDLTEISAEASSDTKYILLYFYYGALILTAVKVRHFNCHLCTFYSFPRYSLNMYWFKKVFQSEFFFQDYDRALYFLEACVTIPAMAVSHIMLEAYKKYLLVRICLIVIPNLDQGSQTQCLEDRKILKARSLKAAWRTKLIELILNVFVK